ncbi:MAG: sensor histidine kinase [Treponemataceae bacterium]|nr:sensor histidine kinase [Treponemataceae bacterium]
MLHRQLTFHIELPAHIRVKMNEALISRALENIVNNAIRYTPEGGLVQISAVLTANNKEECDHLPHKVPLKSKKPEQGVVKLRKQRAIDLDFHEQKKVQPPHILIQIADNGIGIDEEDLPRIFDLFYRGTNSRREAGMGIGLAVVKSILDSHGWSISVHSQKNKGSVFTLLVPLSVESSVY